MIDNGLTRPWTVHKTYRRNAEPRPIWIEYICAEGQQLVRIGDENYMLSGDGLPDAHPQRPVAAGSVQISRAVVSAAGRRWVSVARALSVRLAGDHA